MKVTRFPLTGFTGYYNYLDRRKASRRTFLERLPGGQFEAEAPASEVTYFLTD